MKICPHCHSQNTDTANTCSSCSANISYVQPINSYPNAQIPNYQNAPYQNYQGAPQGYPQYQNGANNFNPNYSRINNDIQNAKTMGIVSIVFIFIMRLVTFVCALLGMSKAKAALREAKELGNEQLIREAQDAYKTNKIALIVTVVLYALAAISGLLVLLLNYGVFQQALGNYV